jgi:hypothetical protein
MSRPAPRYANCSEPTEAPAKRVATPGRVGLPGRPFGGPGAPTLGRRSMTTRNIGIAAVAVVVVIVVIVLLV